jgi:hypothetical protein
MNFDIIKKIINVDSKKNIFFILTLVMFTMLVILFLMKDDYTETKAHNAMHKHGIDYQVPLYYCYNCGKNQ